MKGDIRIWFIRIVIVVMVIAVALYFLVYVQPFDPWFLNPAKYELVRYATCSLALCANGIGSPQVDKIGCLEYEGGRCAKTCRTVVDEFLANKNEITQSTLGGQYFCGENNAIEFNFEPTFPIDIRGGEIQQISKPKWLCRGANILDVKIHFTDSLENLFGECIMYDGLKASSEFDLTKIIGFKEDLENAEGADISCFQNFKKVVFTPLMPYSEIVDSKYSSALYLTDQLTTDCENSYNGPLRKHDNKELQVIPECKFKVSDAMGRKKFKVWSDLIADLAETTLLAGAPPSGGRCSYVVLDRELIESPFREGESLSSSGEQIFPSLVEYNGKLYLFFQDTDSFDQTKGKDSTIFFMESADGRFTNFNAMPIRDLVPLGEQANYRFVQPSVTVFNGHRYLAYATNFGSKGFSSEFDIMVKDVDAASSPTKVTDDEIDQFNPSITSFGDKLYLFYQQQAAGVSEINYKVGTVSGNRIEWSDGQSFPLWQDPSAKATPEGLMFAYSFKDDKGNGIGAAILKNDEWGSAGTVVQNGFINEYPELVTLGNDVFVVFSQGVGSVDNPTQMSRRIMFSRYLGNGKWSTPAPISLVSAKKELMPSAAAFNGKIVLAYSEFTVNFDLKVTSGDLGTSETVSTAQKTEITTGVSLKIDPPDKTSYKQGETVKFVGKLETESSEPKEIKLRLRAHFETLGSIDVPDFPKTVVTDKDGNFELEYTLSHAGVGTYRMTALYDRNVAMVEFEVIG